MGSEMCIRDSSRALSRPILDERPPARTRDLIQSPQLVESTQCMLDLIHQIKRTIQQRGSILPRTLGLHPPHQLPDVLSVALNGPLQHLLSNRVVGGQQTTTHSRPQRSTNISPTLSLRPFCALSCPIMSPREESRPKTTHQTPHH